MIEYILVFLLNGSPVEVCITNDFTARKGRIAGQCQSGAMISCELESNVSQDENGNWLIECVRYPTVVTQSRFGRDN